MAAWGLRFGVLFGLAVATNVVATEPMERAVSASEGALRSSNPRERLNRDLLERWLELARSLPIGAERSQAQTCAENIALELPTWTPRSDPACAQEPRPSNRQARAKR